MLTFCLPAVSLKKERCGEKGQKLRNRLFLFADQNISDCTAKCKIKTSLSLISNWLEGLGELEYFMTLEEEAELCLTLKDEVKYIKRLVGVILGV